MRQHLKHLALAAALTLLVATPAVTATRAATVTYNVDGFKGVTRVVWAGLTQASADVGAGACVPGADMTFQVTGTPGTGGGVPIEGSNDGTNWGPLHDAAGDAIVLGDDEVATPIEAPLCVRPGTTQGDGSTNLTLTLIARQTT
jgi:hypothetical protein